MTDDRPPWIQMNDGPAGEVADDGPGLLDKITVDLQMDKDWVVRTDRSLTWWGAGLPLNFATSDPTEVYGDPGFKLTVSTTVARDVKAETEEVLEAEVVKVVEASGSHAAAVASGS